MNDWKIHREHLAPLAFNLQHGQYALQAPDKTPFFKDSLVCLECDEGAISLDRVMHHVLVTGHIMHRSY